MPSTFSIRTSTFSSSHLDILRGRVRGRVFVPGDDGYDAARQTWNATTFEQQPVVVVLPTNTADVATAVAFAREHDLSVAVQSGGHGHPRPANEALLVNFSSMKQVEITPAGTARVDAGATWSDVIAAAHPHGLAPLNGFAGSVGVGGYTLGGGIGWLARQYGAAAGSLRFAEIVTADGETLEADRENHADLFWAIRGGGGNFGIVTSFEFTLYPVKEIYGGFIAYPLSQGREVLSAYARWAGKAPDRLTSAVRLVHFPPAPLIPEPLRGASAVVIMACFNGSEPEGKALLKPLRSLGTPLLDTFRTMPYSEIGSVASDPDQAPPLFTFGHGSGLRDFSGDVIDAMLQVAGNRASGIFVVEARHLGGALARQPEEAMPFGFRSPWFITALAAAPTEQALQGGRRAVAELFNAITLTLTGEMLINVIDPATSSPEVTRAAYSPENYRRLVALKDKYDPANVFRFNHNIAPSFQTASRL